MTPEQLNELKALEAKATLEPWHGVGYSTIRADHDRWVADTMFCADADLTIALRNHAKELIAAVDRLKELDAEVKKLEQALCTESMLRRG